jgi:pyruvate/2-oxoglutarate dehydrogenase complex dihydrolipoamide acyltransferase (E2) component
MGGRKHMIHGFFEVDVTSSRRLLRAYRDRTGESLSFTGFVAACLGQAVADDRRVQAYRNWRNQIVILDDVDVAVLIEVQAGDRTFPMTHVIRRVNRRTVTDIHREIRSIQAVPTASETKRSFVMRNFSHTPAILRHLVYRLFDLFPVWRASYGGTVVLTSIGMFGSGGGWGLALNSHTLAVTLGGIAEKPAVVDGQIVPRDLLSVTLSFDHDLVDGAPAARFARRFSELIEIGYGLEKALAAG